MARQRRGGAGGVLDDCCSVLLRALPPGEQLALRAASRAAVGAVVRAPSFWDEVLTSRTNRGSKRRALAGWGRYAETVRQVLERGRLVRLRRLFSQLRRQAAEAAVEARARQAARDAARRERERGLLKLCLRSVRKHLAERRLAVGGALGCRPGPELVRDCFQALKEKTVVRRCFHGIRAAASSHGEGPALRQTATAA